MVLLNEAVEWVRDQIKDNVNEGLLGTSGTVASPSNAGLLSPDASTESAVTTGVSGNQITFSFRKVSTTGIGNTYQEYGIRDDTNGVDWTRYVFTALESTGYEDWNIKIRMFTKSI